jgi:chromosomal replication initiation ATPase DnaA
VTALPLLPLTPQPPLPLDWQPRLGEADFFISEANRGAVDWLARPTAWPMPRVLLIGPEAAGKSHLAQLFAARSGARLIDNADLLSDGEPLFHAWNAASAERPLLMAARRLPRSWAHRLPDLASRLAATPLITLSEPDDALLAAVLTKRFADRGLKAPPELVQWLSLRIERSFAAAARAVNLLDAAALAERRELSVPLARRLFDTQLDLGL